MEFLVSVENLFESLEMNPPCPRSRTCHRISTEVVVWGVTDRMVGASSGAVERGRTVDSGGWESQPHPGTHRGQILLTLMSR